MPYFFNETETRIKTIDYAERKRIRFSWADSKEDFLSGRKVVNIDTTLNTVHHDKTMESVMDIIPSAPAEGGI
jgi:hypothetical protein